MSYPNFLMSVKLLLYNKFITKCDETCLSSHFQCIVLPKLSNHILKTFLERCCLVFFFYFKEKFSYLKF